MSMTTAELRRINPDLAAKVCGPDPTRRKADGTGEKSKRKSKAVENKWERDYAAELSIRQAAGEVVGFYAQFLKFRLADATWYTPDFIVFLANGTVEAVEVKGWQRDDAVVKFKVAAETYKIITWRMVTKDGSGWRTMRLLNERAIDGGAE